MTYSEVGRNIDAILENNNDKQRPVQEIIVEDSLFITDSQMTSTNLEEEKVNNKPRVIDDCSDDEFDFSKD